MNKAIYNNVAELEKALCSNKQTSFCYFDRDENGNKVYRKDKKQNGRDYLMFKYGGDIQVGNVIYSEHGNDIV